mmetsp:Transcript_11186/g.21987  ORF Transcript_11186/g.21987 Transcript_11186/m.21987 type:complete len:323 (+) Transcript_11186:169-1137(+)
MLSFLSKPLQRSNKKSSKQEGYMAEEERKRPKLSPEEHKRVLVVAKLASKAYRSWDAKIASFGMRWFRGIADIRRQDFETPDYVRLEDEGSLSDYLGIGDSGFDYTIFKHKETNDLVIAFRGTEPASVRDWILNFKQVFGKSEQYAKAVEVAKAKVAEVDKENKNHGTNVKVSFTGHSLGGGLATACALATGKEAIVFDAAGLSRTTLQDLDLDLGHQDKIANFNVKDDFVADYNRQMDNTTVGTHFKDGVICEQYGKIFWLESISDRATFWIPLPEFMIRAMLGLPALVSPKAFLAHAWHVFTYQIEKKNFIDKSQIDWHV